jgi:hypothetical protein
MNAEEKELINSPKVKRKEVGFNYYDQKIRMISNRLSGVALLIIYP